MLTWGADPWLKSALAAISTAGIQIVVGKRPTILVAEPEPAEALSVRKLVLETAKFNVLTAHTTREAIDIFQSFPNISAVIAVEDHAINCEVVTTSVKDGSPKIPAIALSARAGYRCGAADYHVSSHEPEQLLRLVRELLGDPRDLPTAKIVS